MSTSVLLERKKAARRGEDIGEAGEDIEHIYATISRPPVVVEGDRLEVDSARLETGRVYTFEYLDAKMVLWKSPDNTVDIFQLINE